MEEMIKFRGPQPIQKITQVIFELSLITLFN
jgi:hypothetical protein